MTAADLRVAMVKSFTLLLFSFLSIFGAVFSTLPLLCFSLPDRSRDLYARCQDKAFGYVLNLLVFYRCSSFRHRLVITGVAD